MITLSWPPRELHPNARPHYHAKAKAAKAYREAATDIAIAYGWETGATIDVKPYAVTVQFFPPDRRRRDLDGMLASMKAGFDGICDAFCLNDFMLNPITIERCEPVKGGRVVVTLS